MLGAALPRSGQVVVLEDFGFTPKGDGMEIEAEFLGLGKQQRSQAGDPSGQQSLLAGPRGAVGVVGGIALLGQDIQAGEQAEGLVEVEIGDVAASFLVEQFQGQQTEQRRRRWDHARAGIARLSHQVIEPESGQERQEEKDPGHACAGGTVLVSERVGGNRPWLGDRVVLKGDQVLFLWDVRKPGS